MRIWQLSNAIGTAALVSVALAWRIAAMQPNPAPPPAIVAAPSVAAPANTTTVAKASALSPNALIGAAFSTLDRYTLASFDVTGALPQGRALALTEDNHLQESRSALPTDSAAAARRKLPYLKYYVYSELPPPEKPAEIAVQAMSDIPLGTPLEEIKRAADAFGLDYMFMKTVAKVESDFDPKQRTGSYVGLFQLSRTEFKRYGVGDITNPRDNAVAASYKFLNEAALFAAITHKQPTFSDLYLIHQQGWQGAAEHVSHPERIAWKSMCATDEGVAKGERWCKHAIWWNTLPAVKRQWKSVDRLTSRAFVAMWRDRIDTLYARYAGIEQTQ
jgi:transglycosylase-like protein with SLT domain